MANTPPRNAHDYKEWVDDGYIYVQVRPRIWERMSEEAWLRAVRRRIRNVQVQFGADPGWDGAKTVIEVAREKDWAIPEHSVSKTYRTAERFPAVAVAA